MLTRRSFLCSIPVSLLAAAPAPRTCAAQFEGTTVADIAAAGFSLVDIASRANLIRFAPSLKQAGLRVQSCATETPLITKDWESYADFRKISMEEATASLATAGAEYFVMGLISSGARGDGDDFYRRTADRMNDAALACKKAGLKFAWMLEDFQFEGHAGLRPIDIFHERLDAKLAPMILDTFAASRAGQNPAALLHQWKGRVAIVRLKDRGDLGEGPIDFAAVMKAATLSGVKAFTVGPDLKKNLAFFRKLG